jgi:superfamily II DNA/RNA helicase
MLHGGKSQDQREESIKGFREDVYNVLVATDVAGRGIDVPGVALVINYDMANTVEAYTHRCVCFFWGGEGGWGEEGMMWVWGERGMMWGGAVHMHLDCACGGW